MELHSRRFVEACSTLRASMAAKMESSDGKVNPKGFHFFVHCACDHPVISTYFPGGVQQQRREYRMAGSFKTFPC